MRILHALLLALIASAAVAHGGKKSLSRQGIALWTAPLGEDTRAQK